MKPVSVLINGQKSEFSYNEHLLETLIEIFRQGENHIEIIFKS